MTQVLHTVTSPDLAQVFVVQLRPQPWSIVECVGALDPSIPASDKMVLVVSSQFGCPVRCPMCDAGGWFHGNLTSDEILEQIQLLCERWADPAFPSCAKFKVQFARMGEPALNPAVLDVIDRLPSILNVPSLMPCLATTAPSSAGAWFDQLLAIRHQRYGGPSFQLQFSVQTTDEHLRDFIIPIPKWNLREIAHYAERFVRPGDRTVVLNFALANKLPVDPHVISHLFDPDRCVVKLTPLNPTASARAHGLRTALSHPDDPEATRLVDCLRNLGFHCIVSIGDPRESAMRSSCGQLVRPRLGLSKLASAEQSLSS